MVHRLATLAAVLVLVPGIWSPEVRGQDVKQLKQARDVPALMRLLRHRDSPT